MSQHVQAVFCGVVQCTHRPRGTAQRQIQRRSGSRIGWQHSAGHGQDIEPDAIALGRRIRRLQRELDGDAAGDQKQLIAPVGEVEVALAHVSRHDPLDIDLGAECPVIIKLPAAQWRHP